jgi:hypothetical protein
MSFLLALSSADILRGGGTHNEQTKHDDNWCFQYSRQHLHSFKSSQPLPQTFYPHQARASPPLAARFVPLTLFILSGSAFHGLFTLTLRD